MNEKICGDCRLFEVIKTFKATEQKKAADGLRKINYDNLNPNEKVAYDNLMLLSLIPDTKLGRRMHECEPQRKAGDGFMPCEHPDKFTPLEVAS